MSRRELRALARRLAREEHAGRLTVAQMRAALRKAVGK